MKFFFGFLEAANVGAGKVGAASVGAASVGAASIGAAILLPASSAINPVGVLIVILDVLLAVRTHLTPSGHLKIENP
jgi:hypothetical protein